MPLALDSSVKKKFPLLFCICAPAGSGKSSVSHRILESVAGIRQSISTTTRAPRPHEVEGEHYFFVSVEEFKRRVEQGLFIEHAEFGGNLYGIEQRNFTQGSPSASAGAELHDILFTVDIQGVARLKELFADQVITIFLFPPSFQALEQRLRARGTESEESIQRRLERAHHEVEILASPGFSQYLVINDTLEQSAQVVASIIFAERNKLVHLAPGALHALLG